MRELVCLMLLCERRIVSGVVEECSYLGIGDWPDHVGWNPGNKRARWDMGAFENYSTRCNETSVADSCPIHDNCPHPYQYSVADCGAVAYGDMAKGRVIADGKREPGVGMEDTVVLDIRSGADVDWCRICPDDCAVPDARFRPYGDVTYDSGVGCYPCC